MLGSHTSVSEYVVDLDKYLTFSMLGNNIIRRHRSSAMQPNYVLFNDVRCCCFIVKTLLYRLGNIAPVLRYIYIYFYDTVMVNYHFVEHKRLTLGHIIFALNSYDVQTCSCLNDIFS